MHLVVLMIDVKFRNFGITFGHVGHSFMFHLPEGWSAKPGVLFSASAAGISVKLEVQG